MTASAWDDLAAELDRWDQAGRTIRLWLRDDDAIAPSDALVRLDAMSMHFDLPVLLAIIPAGVDRSLAEALRAMPNLLPCQHGCAHANHAVPGNKKSEFGPDRDRAGVVAEIAAARDRLRELFGATLLPVFVPPWNRIDRDIAALLPDLGFVGVSCFRGFALGPGGGPAIANTHLDVMDWQGGRIGRAGGDLAEELTGLLQAMRAQTAPDPALGILLHHRDHDETAWAALDRLLTMLLSHPAVKATNPRALFSAQACRNASAPRPA